MDPAPCITRMQCISLWFVFCFFHFGLLRAQPEETGMPAGIKAGLQETRIPVCVLPELNRRVLQSEDSLKDLNKGSFRFGYNHFLNCNPSNSGLWISLGTGERIWRIRIRCPLAQTLNLAFSNYHLPEGARLFVYSADQTLVLGAFSSRHNHPDKEMGTDLIRSDDVVVEYDEPAEVAGKGTFTIFRVTQGYRSFSYDRSFGQAGSCIQNVNCPEGLAWSNQRRSVVCLVANGNEFGSGTLINNTASDGTPYILTANHLGKPGGSWVFRFNWESAGCTDPASSPSVLQSISGAVPVAQNAGSDFSLCRMSAAPPSSYLVFYAGWSNLNAAADSVCCIHHPSGDIKKIALSKNPVSPGLYNGADVWQTGLWTDGCTESGSSGSGLFDQNRRIVGQLFGGPSGCGVQTSQDFDYYGKFSTSWNNDTLASGRLRDWLDPGNTGALTNNGFDPNGLLVKENEAASFEIYPNPGARLFIIQLKKRYNPLCFDLYDSSGKCVLSETPDLLSGDCFQLNLENLPRGFYFLRLKTGDTVSSRKLILE